MVIGKLPWGDAARSKAKATVAAMKKHMYENPVEYIAWMREELLNKVNVDHKMTCSTTVDCMTCVCSRRLDMKRTFLNEHRTFLCPSLSI